MSIGSARGYETGYGSPAIGRRVAVQPRSGAMRIIRIEVFILRVWSPLTIKRGPRWGCGAPDPVLVQALRSQTGRRETGHQRSPREIVIQRLQPCLIEETAGPPAEMTAFAQHSHDESKSHEAQLGVGHEVRKSVEI